MIEDTPAALGYSGGSSSEWMIRAMERGLIQRPRRACVVCADTGEEHSWTNAAIAEVQQLCEDIDLEFIMCRADTKLGDDLIALKSWDGKNTTRADHPPVFIAKGRGCGRAMHKCTGYYKIAPMRRAISQWLERHGEPKRVVKWIGFSADEGGRAEKAVGRQDVAWERLRFPAIELGVSRAQQRADLVAWTGRAPKFSMCVFCPFKSTQRWLQTDPTDLARAIEVDEAIRDLDCIGLTEGEAFLTNRLMPIADLIAKGDPQPELPGFESYCDSGACFL